MPLAKRSSTARPRVLVACAADEIVRYAELNRISHISVSHSLRERFDRWLLSAAREVVAHAPCTVTVVRA